MSRDTYFRHKRKVEEKKFIRLYYIPTIDFQDQHLDNRIDNLNEYRIK
ncbi:MAG: hypothetical protein MRJ93_08040 [Nitrososphaeraceae archaeon]|nr:hypothetical protein [Nitrososphaeraceae archaeon]